MSTFLWLLTITITSIFSKYFFLIFSIKFCIKSNISLEFLSWRNSHLDWGTCSWKIIRKYMSPWKFPKGKARNSTCICKMCSVTDGLPSQRICRNRLHVERSSARCIFINNTYNHPNNADSYPPRTKESRGSFLDNLLSSRKYTQAS